MWDGIEGSRSWGPRRDFAPLFRQLDQSDLINLSGRYDLGAISDAAYSAALSHDTLVILDASDMIPYIREVARILRPGGRALLHYSNYDSQPEGGSANGRGFFSEKMMRHFALKAGLRIVESKTLPHPIHVGAPHNDALTLLEKAA